MTHKVLLRVLLGVFIATISAQASQLLAQSEFDPKVPTPQSIIGHAVGDRFTHFYQAEAYYQAVAKSNERVKLIKYGETYEGRSLYVLILSSPENLKRLEEIQKNLKLLSDPRTTSAQDAESLAQSTIPVCWLSYNVHGNESSSAEAAIEVVYRLAASQDADVQFILQNTVVIIDPLVNPDGRERYVNFYDQMMGKSPNPDVNAAEHVENWPGGRFNHYLFDLNRDWAWQTQSETRARIKLYRLWNPQVHVDYHEMGADSSYYFPPNALPINTNIPPQVTKWLKIFGQENAKAFDQKGWAYFTHEAFDLLYPAYGDSWPAFNGAIGMTYEQGGGGAGGLLVKRRDDTLLSLKARIDHHVTTSFATMMTAARNRVALLHDFYQARKDTIDEGLHGPVKAYLIPPGSDNERIAEMINLLTSQGVEVKRATREFSAEGTHDYFGSPAADKQFPAGTFIVEVAQPLGRLVRALLEPDAVLKEKFFYDITAWAMPLAYGVDAFYSDNPISVSEEEVHTVSFEEGGVNGRAAAAYVFEWKTNSAARLLMKLLQADFKASVAIKGFTLKGKQFSPGTIVVQVDRNKPELHEKIAAFAKEFHVSVYAEDTMLSEAGIDLGSDFVRDVRKPKIAVLMGPPVAPSEYGAIWNMFDNKYQIEFAPLKVDQLRTVDLKNYNVLIFPDDSNGGRAYSRAIDRGTVEKLKAWVRDGGSMVGIKGGAVFATEKRAGLVSITYHYVLKRDEEARIDEEKAAQAPPAAAGKPTEAGPPASATTEQPKKEAEDKDLSQKLLTWTEKEEKAQTNRIPGALMQIQLDNSEPLAFGYSKEVVIANMTSPILGLTSKGDNVGYYPKEHYRVSGFITDENLKKFSNSAYLLREDVGRGHVILYADDPNFRAFWEGTSRLFLNSIFFGAIENPAIR